MSYLAEPGHVFEVKRSHYTIALVGDIVILQKNELLLIVRGTAYQGEALRLDTGELVHVSLLETCVDRTSVYDRVWP